MRAPCACLAIVTWLGCVSSGVGPGVLREDWQEPRRDPDPFRDPNAEITTSPWAEEAEASCGPISEQEQAAERAAAVFLLAVTGNAIPLLTWYGTFEEDPAQRRKLRGASPAPR
jgi:hypothetical protein